MNAVKIDPIVRLLSGLLVFLTLCLFASEVWFKTDGQFFQVVSGMATGVLGALLGIITGHAKAANQADPDKVATISMSTPVTPPAPPKEQA